jgi:hypothetical protein
MHKSQSLRIREDVTEESIASTIERQSLAATYVHHDQSPNPGTNTAERNY